MKIVCEFIDNIMYALRKSNVRLNWLYGDDQISGLKLGAEIVT